MYNSSQCLLQYVWLMCQQVLVCQFVELHRWQCWNDPTVSSNFAFQAMSRRFTNPTMLGAPLVPWQDEPNRYEARRTWDKHVLQQNTWPLIVWIMWTHKKYRRTQENHREGGTSCLFDTLVHSFVWVLEIAVTCGGFLREEWFRGGLGICLERLGCLVRGAGDAWSHLPLPSQLVVEDLMWCWSILTHFCHPRG